MFLCLFQEMNRLWRLCHDDSGGAVLRFSVLFSWNGGSENPVIAVDCLQDWIIMMIQSLM